MGVSSGPPGGAGLCTRHGSLGARWAVTPGSIVGIILALERAGCSPCIVMSLGRNDTDTNQHRRDRLQSSYLETRANQAETEEWASNKTLVLGAFFFFFLMMSRLKEKNLIFVST